jgi:uncharacterized protein YndB with AHSA1/START domain
MYAAPGETTEMSTTRKTSKPSISDASVEAKTGKQWSEWFALLDKAGARRMAHKDIAIWLHDKQGVPDWWSQMVTVEYEKARGMRALHQKTDGFAIGASKTIHAPVATLYNAFADARTRRKWLPGAQLRITTATENKSLRIAWANGTRVSVSFYPKGGAKAQVTIQHEKLSDGDAATAAKTYWAEALGRLAALATSP